MDCRITILALALMPPLRVHAQARTTRVWIRTGTGSVSIPCILLLLLSMALRFRVLQLAAAVARARHTRAGLWTGPGQILGMTLGRRTSGDTIVVITG